MPVVCQSKCACARSNFHRLYPRKYAFFSAIGNLEKRSLCTEAAQVEAVVGIPERQVLGNIQRPDGIPQTHLCWARQPLFTKRMLFILDDRRLEATKYNVVVIAILQHFHDFAVFLCADSTRNNIYIYINISFISFFMLVLLVSAADTAKDDWVGSLSAFCSWLAVGVVGNRKMRL